MRWTARRVRGGRAHPASRLAIADVVFCVVDLETTGADPVVDHITEIGAVTVRAGVVLAGFSTLVQCAHPIPAAVTQLTGLSSAMLTHAPPVRDVLRSFAHFRSGCVLVAHNADFDSGFLAQAHHAHRMPWPDRPIVDTLRLARHLLTRDEVADRRLGTLADHFQAATAPSHRALDDVLATVDVLYGLLARAPQVRTLGDLLALSTDPAVSGWSRPPIDPATALLHHSPAPPGPAAAVRQGML